MNKKEITLLEGIKERAFMLCSIKEAKEAEHRARELWNDESISRAQLHFIAAHILLTE